MPDSSISDTPPAAPRNSDPGPITPQDAAHAKAVAQKSLSETRQLRHAALTLACPEHEAVYGAYCFRTVKGICRERLDRAEATLARSSRVGGEQLHEFANAQRRANFHRAQRERGIR